MILRFSGDGKSEMVVVVWDFGGQKVAHPSHAYRALDPQFSDSFDDEHVLFQRAENNDATFGVHSLTTGLPRHAQRAVEPTRHLRSAVLNPETTGNKHAPGGWLGSSRCMPVIVVHQTGFVLLTCACL